MNTYCGPGALCALTHLIIITTLSGRHSYYFHFIPSRTEAGTNVSLSTPSPEESSEWALRPLQSRTCVLSTVGSASATLNDPKMHRLKTATCSAHSSVGQQSGPGLAGWRKWVEAQGDLGQSWGEKLNCFTHNNLKGPLFVCVSKCRTWRLKERATHLSSGLLAGDPRGHP